MSKFLIEILVLTICYINISHPISSFLLIIPIFILSQLDNLSHIIYWEYWEALFAFAILFISIILFFNLIFFIAMSSIAIKNLIKNKTLPIKKILLKNYILPISIIHILYIILLVLKPNCLSLQLNNIYNSFFINTLLIFLMNYFFINKWENQQQSYGLSSVTIINFFAVLINLLFVITIMMFFSVNNDFYKFIYESPVIEIHHKFIYQSPIIVAHHIISDPLKILINFFALLIN